MLRFLFFFLKKWAIPGLFLFIFVFSIQLIINKCSIKFCRWLESNCGPLVSKSTALATEPQPLPPFLHIPTSFCFSFDSLNSLLWSLCLFFFYVRLFLEVFAFIFRSISLHLLFNLLQPSFNSFSAAFTYLQLFYLQQQHYQLIFAIVYRESKFCGDTKKCFQRNISFGAKKLSRSWFVSSSSMNEWRKFFCNVSPTSCLYSKQNISL